MLTDSLRKTLEFICSYIKQHGYAPKLPEIAEGIGIQSTGVVHRYVNALQEAGYIMIEPHKHRGIRLLDENYLIQTQLNSHSIPLLGKIAAGRPIEAIPGEDSIEMDQIFPQSDLFALRVQGDSMIEAGILDEDIIVCKATAHANNGQIVVALIDQEEATLKYLYHNKNNTITLMPANKNYSPMIYNAQRITIQGHLVGQLRFY